MEYTDYLFRRLKSIEAGEQCFLINFNYKYETFLSEWLSEKTKDWEGILNQILNLIEKLIGEIELSKSYVFTKLSDYKTEHPNVEIYGYDSTSYPKMPMFPFDNIVIKNEDEELIAKRRTQPKELLIEIGKLRVLIKKCLYEFKENNDSPIFNPKYKVIDRIPFYGNEQTLSVFANLLIKGGFILGNEAVSEDIIPKSDRAKFKIHMLAKKELAQRLTEIFFCVEKEKSTDNVKISYPKSSTLESKMQLQTMKRMDPDDIERLEKGFTQILESMTAALE